MNASRNNDCDFRPRHLDLALVAATAPLWVPLLAILLALKALIDGGPVLFSHVRLGRNCVPFLLYKIRTTPSEFAARPEDWPGEDFPPRTPFGQWLRRWDLDELPQLWNVLRGEMALVGPRPETPYHTAKFAASMPRLAERLAVRPGLTGLAQVRGWRGDTNLHARLASDLEYISRRSFRTWLGILLRTIWIEASGHDRSLTTTPHSEPRAKQAVSRAESRFRAARVSKRFPVRL